MQGKLKVWSFIVGGSIFLVNFVNKRDFNLLNRYAEDPSVTNFLEGVCRFRPRKFVTIVGL